MASPLELEKFHYQEFDVSGNFINDIMFKGKWCLLLNVLLSSTSVINFTVRTYEEMNNNCLQGNTWSFDSTFLFVGSVATTIGLIQIDSASPQNWSQIFNTNIESIRLWKCYTKNQARKDNLHDIYRNDLKNPKSPLRLKIPAFW